jgi:hypothetical protein
MDNAAAESQQNVRMSLGGQNWKQDEPNNAIHQEDQRQFDIIDDNLVFRAVRRVTWREVYTYSEIAKISYHTRCDVVSTMQDS